MAAPVPDTPATRPHPAGAEAPASIGYARYVLAVLVLVYVFNFLDRQILSILAERIKRDLGLTDAQLGFLYGTAFAVFYALFGIPLGRLADTWDRRRLISLGIGFWSAMTALSGFARTFFQLGAARIGVGVGEASASPAAFSMLSDYFPQRVRATVLAIYASGIYIGGGVGIFLGGAIVDHWDVLWAHTAPPFGLRGWQVAFFVVGLPGLLLALWVRTLREPLRGQIDGIFAPPEPTPFRKFALELASIFPPFTFWSLWRHGGSRRDLAFNLAAALGITLCAVFTTKLLGTGIQWGALGIGLYAAVSWGQSLRLRDAPTFALIFHTASLRWSALSFSFLAFTGYALGFWTAPYFVRVLGVREGDAGLVLGLTAAVAGFVGVTLGGVLADRWRRRGPKGPLCVAILTAILPVPIAVVMFTTENRALAYALNFPLAVLGSMWLGPGASTVQDLVLPRMRASASAAYLLVITFVGLAMGPYAVGRMSLALGSLRAAILWALCANALSLLSTGLALRRITEDTASRIDRARAAGETLL
ncbi:MAG TPA: MFS transporter [Myxococcota bacterium]|nr:MFS transporter [Myxococcota bacterium]